MIAATFKKQKFYTISVKTRCLHVTLFYIGKVLKNPEFAEIRHGDVIIMTSLNTVQLACG